MMVFPAPDPREGSRLAAAIETATGHRADVTLHDGEWHILTDAAEVDVQPVVDAHDGTPDANPQDEFLAAIDAATTLAELKAALVGNGLPAQVQARGKPAQ